MRWKMGEDDKECSGLFGKIFGHKIKSLIKKYEPQPVGRVCVNGLAEFAEANAKKEFRIVCVGCGENYG